MQMISNNIRNISYLFTHAKDIHEILNTKPTLILLCILFAMIFVILTEIKIYKVKKSIIYITLLINLCIFVGCILIFNQSVIANINNNSGVRILQMILIGIWLFIATACIESDKEVFTDGMAKYIIAITFITIVLFIGWLFNPSAFTF